MFGVEFTAEFLTALSVFVTTIIGAVIALRKEFRKVAGTVEATAVKVDETHNMVNSQLTRVIDVMDTGRADAVSQRDIAQAEVQDLRKGTDG